MFLVMTWFYFQFGTLKIFTFPLFTWSVSPSHFRLKLCSNSLIFSSHWVLQFFNCLFSPLYLSCIFIFEIILDALFPKANHDYPIEILPNWIYVSYLILSITWSMSEEGNLWKRILALDPSLNIYCLHDLSNLQNLWLFFSSLLIAK